MSLSDYEKQDIELCVREADLEKATSIFNSGRDVLQLRVQDEYNIYTEYFRYLSDPQVHVIIFTDTFYHLEPLQKNTIQADEHEGWTEYSPQILNIVPADAVRLLPLPRLPPFLNGLCERYVRSRDPMATMAAKQLVIELNLDDGWCRVNLLGDQASGLKFVLALVEGRQSRVDDFVMGLDTYFLS